MRLLVILPVLKDDANEERNRKELSLLKGPNLTFEVRSLPHGPASIESEFDDRMASPWILDEVVKARQEDFDAIFVSCMGDVAINAARELTKTPVVAPLQTCLAVASTLGDRTGVVTVVKNLVPVLYRKAREYGFDKNLAGLRSIEIPVLKLEKDRRRVVQALISESSELVEKNHTDSIILGCTGLLGVAKEVQDRIDVPVLDPVPVSVRFAEMLVATKLTQSRTAFHPPPRKLRSLPGINAVRES